MTFRGAIESVGRDLPQVLFSVAGAADVFIEAPFAGVLLAPNAAVRFQAARPDGHRAVVHAKSV